MMNCKVAQMQGHLKAWCDLHNRFIEDCVWEEWQFLKLQKYEAAAKYLRAEAKKIPLGEGNVQKGFSSTYNALEFAAQVLEDAVEAVTEKPVGVTEENHVNMHPLGCRCLDGKHGTAIEKRDGGS